jgi:hypothetical protein
MKPKTAVAIPASFVSAQPRRISKAFLVIIVSTAMFAASCTASRGGYGCPSQNIPAAKSSFRAR